MSRVPTWWEFVLLALAGYRVWRLVARDTITAPVRAALTYPDDEAVTLETIEERGRLRLHNRLLVYGEAGPRSWRVYLATLIRCHWCLGSWVSLVAWGAWELEARWTLVVATPFAVAATIGILGHLVDS